MSKKKRRYFEGWYFKHRIGTNVFAVIPGMSADEEGNRVSFIQVISNDFTAYYEFPFDTYRAERSPLCITIGPNRFSESGVHLELQDLRAELRYGKLTPLEGGDIMGPFGKLPFMECYHGITSLRHEVHGYAEINGERRSFDEGSGYIEQDWGSSFPESWVWLECHAFEGAGDASVMLAIARIPFLGLRFTGIIGLCRIGGRQYRLATYRGVRLLRQAFQGGIYTALLRQGQYRLEVRVKPDKGGALRAPCLGQMNRMIIEYPGCDVQVRFRRQKEALLDAKGSCCGFEMAKNAAASRE